MQKTATALLSGVLLFCSFPPLEYYALAWIALLPLLYLSFCSKPGESFCYGLLTGVVFWLASIFWLTRVTFIGWFFVSFYCASYFAVFALTVSWWHNLRYKNFPPQADPPAVDKKVGRGHAKRLASLWPSCLNLMFLFGAPALWVSLEYARAHFLTGFPWNLIGVSQYSCISLIQCADWGGVYLVSYLVVMGNTAFALLMSNYRDGILKPSIGLVSFLLIILLVSGYGKWQLSRPAEQLETIRTAAVQLNVPQQYKWSQDWASDIYRRLKKSTVAVCRPARPDLIVWPETALPDFARYSDESRAVVDEALGYGVSLLIGSMDYEVRLGKTNYFNSAFLFLPGEHPPSTFGAAMRSGEAQIYEKRHLVLFGEYVPCARFLPFLRSITGLEEDFTPGTKNVLFRLNDKKFSVLICFEDTLPYLARECVKAGARLLINQTNDAWFDPSWASRQHMAHCVFRCVENRVACLRATNTGLTCYIDRRGVIRSSIEPSGPGGVLREPQVMRSEVKFSPANMSLTFYTRHGDLFALACVAFSLPLFIGTLLSFLRKRKTPAE